MLVFEKDIKVSLEELYHFMSDFKIFNIIDNINYEHFIMVYQLL